MRQASGQGTGSRSAVAPKPAYSRRAPESLQFAIKCGDREGQLVATLGLDRCGCLKESDSHGCQVSTEAVWKLSRAERVIACDGGTGSEAMGRYVEGQDRTQSALFPERLDDWVHEDSTVRVIDVLVDELDLGNVRKTSTAMGSDRYTAAATKIERG